MDKDFLAQYSNFSKEELCDLIFKKCKEYEILKKSLLDSNVPKEIKDRVLLLDNLEKRLFQCEKEKSYHEHRANELQRKLLKLLK